MQKYHTRRNRRTMTGTGTRPTEAPQSKKRANPTKYTLEASKSILEPHRGPQGAKTKPQGFTQGHQGEGQRMQPGTQGTATRERATDAPGKKADSLALTRCRFASLSQALGTTPPFATSEKVGVCVSNFDFLKISKSPTGEVLDQQPKIFFGCVC